GLRAGAPGWPRLFRDMPWGTDRVLAATLARTSAAGLRAAYLRTLCDVDEPADWEAWLRRTVHAASGG
ncbi:MAG TPA: glycosyltransferase, partial [Verrucomicrobiota bacterium]|nr:glycosyltransferase [Verrucomicrobiota bacterium]